jgi:hypothetical protein
MAADNVNAYAVLTGKVTHNYYSLRPEYKRYAHGSIAKIDINIGKILSQATMLEDEFRIGHFKVLSNNNIIAVTSTDIKTGRKPGGIIWGHVEETTLKQVALPDLKETKTGTEKFDIAVDEKNHVAAVSDSVLGDIFLISTDTGKCIDKMPLSAFGVTYDPYRSRFIVNGQYLNLLDDHFHKVDGGSHALSLIKGPFRSGHSIII